MIEMKLAEGESLSIPEGDLAETLAMTLYGEFDRYVEIEFPNPVNQRCYVLRPRGYIGQIPVSGDVLLRIEPKVPIANVFRMLEYAYNLKSFRFFDAAIKVSSLDDLYERLASILAKRVLERARKGLYRGYVGEEETLPYIRGRVRVVPSVRGSLRGSTLLDCEYEEHTADLDDNRILAWTLYRLPRLRLCREEVRRLVRQAYRAVAGAVEVSPVGAKDCIGRLYHRLNEDYRPMHGLCRFFLEHCGPGIDEGGHEFIPFVLNMPALFETFVAEWLREHLPPDQYVTPQYRAELDDLGLFSFRIDLVLRDAVSDQVLAVLDTKYKESESPDERDIQQIVAYAESMHTDRAFIVYPSSTTRSVSLRVGGKRVRTMTFDIGKDPDESGRVFLQSLGGCLN